MALQIDVPDAGGHPIATITSASMVMFSLLSWLMAEIDIGNVPAVGLAGGISIAGVVMLSKQLQSVSADIAQRKQFLEDTRELLHKALELTEDLESEIYELRTQNGSLRVFAEVMSQTLTVGNIEGSKALAQSYKIPAPVPLRHRESLPRERVVKEETHTKER